jgi:hypothetical protein
MGGRRENAEKLLCTGSDANAGEQRASEENRHTQAESFARSLQNMN